MANFTYDKHFIKFKKDLELAVIGGSKNDDEFTKKQKKMVEDLVKSEKKFRNVLIKSSHGKLAYSKFLDLILNDYKNIRFARPFFRERQKDFSSKISNSIKNREVEKLFKFNINYPFINFIIKAVPFPPNRKSNESR